MYRRILALAAALSLMAGSASAKLLVCEIAQLESSWGWFAPTIRFEYQDGADTALVNDFVIHDKYGKPVEAAIDTNSDKRTTFVWTVKVKSREKQFVAKGDAAGGMTTFNKVKFRLTHIKTDGKATISAISGIAYLNEPSSYGTCSFL